MQATMTVTEDACLAVSSVATGPTDYLAGDFYCPKSELPDGTIVGWGKPEQRSVEENLFERFTTPSDS